MPTSPLPNSVARVGVAAAALLVAPVVRCDGRDVPAAAGRCADQPAVRRPAVPVVRRASGLTYAVGAGTPVSAAAAGTVTFSGVVVDVRYVVVRHGDGLLATYGGLASTPLQHGDAVAAGSIVGRSGGGLYFGLRTGPDTYIDPQPLLGELVVPPYLVPTDGTPRRPPPEPVLRCRPV